MSKLLRVNMTEMTAGFEAVPDKYQEMGGRWLTSTIVADEVDPMCHPLGPNNKLVFAPGMITGTASPTSGRISVGGKSPLTGGIKEANAGTKFAAMQANLGIKAIIVEGQPPKDKLFTLVVDKDGARLVPADNLANSGAYATTHAMIERYGGSVGICCIGPAGEMKMANSGIAFNDMSNGASRYAGRGGLGAVMGTKGLKSIVIDDQGAAGVPLADSELFTAGRDKLREALQTHDITKPRGALNTYGTAVLINIMNEAGGLPTRNFSGGRFEGATKVAGEAIFEGNKERLGKEVYNHACSPGCTIQCSNTWHAADGSEIASCVEYETDWAFGPNCGIDDLDTIAKLTYMCNDIGLDTIEAGVTIGVAMEAGVIPFGDGPGAIRLLEEILEGTPLGHVLGNGAQTTGNVYGVTRIPTVKGQAMPAYEPRVVKGIGITYATSTMGADHTAGYTIAPEILAVGGQADAREVKEKGALSRGFQEATAFIDSTGHCLFIAFAVLDIPEGFEGVVEECNGVLGTNWTMDDVARIGREVLNTERAFNRAAGMGKEHDRLPEFMTYETLPPHNAVWDVPDDMLDSVHS